jgi:hypothetical protein
VIVPVPFTTEPETRPGFHCTAYRWTFQLGLHTLALVHQHQIEGEWHDSHTRVWGLFWHGAWMWGPKHFWYDGPHCIFALGPVRVQWFQRRCTRCRGEKNA